MKTLIFGYVLPFCTLAIVVGSKEEISLNEIHFIHFRLTGNLSLTSDITCNMDARLEQHF